MKSKLNRVIIACLVFGSIGFTSSQAATTTALSTEELFGELQQFVERVNQSFAQFAQALSDLDGRVSENEARTTALENSGLGARINALESRIAALETVPKATTSPTAPTEYDDINAGFTEGSVWIDTTRAQASILLHDAPGAAVWEPITDQTFYEVGEKGPAGGIVFYVTASGMHGLEAAPEDQGVAPWGCIDRVLEGAEENAIGTGAQNTAHILAGCPYTGIAARLANDYSYNGYSDWFLPSKDELNEMQANQMIIGGFVDFGFYWSSSDIRDLLLPGDREAWGQYFFTRAEVDSPPRALLRNSQARVRAIRAF